ncbi:MAG: hypothetical protein PF448_12960 [Bacteroidales bacterium]|jgi:hypothetical protein|nr:hypothetical protein [Bacteroidales bacterium]
MIQIGEILHSDYQRSGMQAQVYADKLGITRANLYSIFRRNSIDTHQLLQFSLRTGTNFFKVFNEFLRNENPALFVEEDSVESKRAPKRSVMIEVEVSEAEYQKLRNKQ